MIFQAADLGAVADFRKLVPLLMEEMRKMDHSCPYFPFALPPPPPGGKGQAGGVISQRVEKKSKVLLSIIL
jgi:hypothetical protein